jgi:hypothetical protein
MTVALFLTDPHTFEGSPAYVVEVREALTGHPCASFLLVLRGNGAKEYITPGGQVFNGAKHSLDDVLNAIVQRPRQEAAKA